MKIEQYKDNECLYSKDKIIKKEKKLKKWKDNHPSLYNFIKDKGGLILAPLIVLVIYIIGLVIYQIFPFSDINMVASYDLSAQICPFIEHLFDVIDGKSSLFYSYSIVGGADVFGTFAYFFISPFSFIYLLAGDGNVYNAAGIVMALKLATIAFIGTFFVKKLFRNIPNYIGAAMGVLYTYSGYTFVASTYVNWIDFLIYMPLAVIAFVYFVRSNKFIPFSIVLACCIYTSFSIACFSMFIVFPTLVTYGIICVKKENRNKFIAYLCLSFVVAVLVASPILVSSLMSYIRCGRGGGLFDELWYGFTDKDGHTKFDEKYFFERCGEAWYRKFSYIFSDTIFLSLTIIYFVRKKLKTQMSKFMLVAGIFTLMPVFVDEVTLLMNMGSYMSYALRFGFLNAIYFFGCACLTVNDCSFKENSFYDGTENNGHNLDRYILIYMGICAISAIIITAFISGENYLNIWDEFIKDSAILKDAHSFPSMFAHSLGGLQVIIVLFVLVTIPVFIGAKLLKNKKITARVMAISLMIVGSVQTLFYNDQIIAGNSSTHYNINSYKNMVEVLNEKDDSYFRIKDYEDKVTSNIPFTGNSNSFSVFSSVIDKDNFAVHHLFGYSGNGRNSFKSYRGDAFGDAFLGYKYFFTSGEKNKGKWEEVNNLSYTEPVKVIDKNGNSVQLSSGAFSMFENKIVFPSAYTVSSDKLKFSMENINSYNNRKNNQKELFEFLSGSPHDSVISVYDLEKLSKELWKRSGTVEVGAGKMSVEINADKDQYLFMNFVASKGYNITVNGNKSEFIDNDLNFILVKLDEGKNTVEFSYSSPYVKYFILTLFIGIILLVAVLLIVNKTKFMDNMSGVISWAGIILSTSIVLFFMVFPTLVFLGKFVIGCWAKIVLLF